MAKFKLSKFSIFLIVLALLVAGAAFYYIHGKAPNIPNYTDNAPAPTPTAPGISATGSNPQPTTSGPPTTLNLPIPFTSQAPTANWDLEHNEDCEEAAGVMANAYLTGDTEVVIPAARVESEMTKLNNWEDGQYGYHLDTTAQETANMIEAVYSLKATVQNGYTFQNIKDALNAHSVVILPVDGQVIGNPNYTGAGPIYHMLVIRGYTSTGLITDDSGTRRGQNYPYSFDTLHSAAADWDHQTNTIDRSKQPMIIVSK